MRAILLAAGVLLAADAAEAAKRPDLRVTTVTVASPALSAVVRNAGPGAARSSVAELRVDGQRVQRRKLKSIKRGKRRTARFTLPALAAGTHTARICADATQRVRERREKNNCRAAAVLVADPLPDPTPTPEPTPSPSGPPALTIGDVTLAEGPAAVFPVSLSAARSEDTVIGYATQSGTASGSVFFGDYSPKSGSVTIPAGATSTSISINTSNDGEHEADEYFLVDLTDPGGVDPVDLQGRGTITDDDPFRITSAVALSNRWVRVNFNGFVDPDSVDLEAFDFQMTPGDPQTGIPQGDQVLLQVAPTVAGQTYTLGATTINAQATGDQVAATTVNFQGWPNRVLLNEVAPNVSGPDDRIELRTTVAGPIGGITVYENSGSGPITFATLPDITLAEHEVIVVHANASTTATTETTSKTQCTDPACYPGAWDVKGNNSIPWSSRVVEVRDGTQVLDAVPFTRGSGTDAPANFTARFNDLRTAFQWEQGCTGGCDEAQAQTLSELWSGVGTTLAGDTVRRIAAVDTNSGSDWATGPQSLGALNP